MWNCNIFLLFAILQERGRWKKLGLPRIPSEGRGHGFEAIRCHALSPTLTESTTCQAYVHSRI